MARKLSWRESGLVAVLALAAVTALYYRKLPIGFGEAGGQTEARALPKGDPPRVHIEQLEHANESYDPDGRNLFSYHVPQVRRPDPPLPPPPVVRPAPPPVAVPVDNDPRPLENVQREPTPPTPNFKYIGSMGPKERKIAVFDTGKNVEIRGVGDVVQDHYRVVGFGYESVVLGYVDERFKGKTTELRKRSGSK